MTPKIGALADISHLALGELRLWLEQNFRPRIAETQIVLTDSTFDDVSSGKHGLAPKSPADATKFLNGAAAPAYAQVKGSDLSMSDVATNDVSTSKHGFAPKLPNDATKYLDGTGAYSVPAGAGGSMTLIADTTLGASAATIDFSSIASTYKHLLLLLHARSDRAATTADYMVIRFNNDSSAIYYLQQANASGTTLGASESLAQTFGRVVLMTAATATANRFSGGHIWIPNYANTSAHKDWLSDAVWPSGTATATLEREMFGGVWASAAAINRITLLSLTGSNIIAGSRVSLYGVS